MTPAGILIPVQQSPPRDAGNFDPKRVFWKIVLTSREVLQETPNIEAATRSLRMYGRDFCVALLSRGLLTQEYGPHSNMPAIQRSLARLFFNSDTLKKVDQWVAQRGTGPEVYLFSKQQMLATTLIALRKTKGFGKRTWHLDPFTGIGRALLHVAGLLDPLADGGIELEDLSPQEQERHVVPFVLRNLLFNAHDDYVAVAARYYEMVSYIAPSLNRSPNFIDLGAV